MGIALLQVKRVLPSILSSLAVILLGLIVFTGCSTEKYGWAHRSYHNTTARFNGYFNANERIKEALQSLKQTRKEDYTKILPVYIYGDEVTSKGLYPQMNEAIEKSSTVIDRHSMPARESNKTKKKEYCQWIDDNFFLIGKAHFYKREFKDARTFLKYVSRAEEFKHSALRFEALLWLAKTHIEEENFSEASKNT